MNSASCPRHLRQEVGAELDLNMRTLECASLSTNGRYLHADPSDSSVMYVGSWNHSGNFVLQGTACDIALRDQRLPLGRQQLHGSSASPLNEEHVDPYVRTLLRRAAHQYQNRLRASVRWAACDLYHLLDVCGTRFRRASGMKVPLAQVVAALAALPQSVQLSLQSYRAAQ